MLVLSGIMGFYLASSRLMYSMSRDGYLPEWFGQVDAKYGTPKNAMIFCIIVSLSGPILGREALGWFVDMSAIGASIGYFFTCASTLVTTRKYGDGTAFLKVMAFTGVGVQRDLHDPAADPDPGTFRRTFRKGKLHHAGGLDRHRTVFYIKERSNFVNE